ncbi:hypothetical protein [Tessaracoccus flavus]|uniref:Uncharacterized protein n=1 Tax=Tessaracoccus flavus TaxID=1610493 RepID=A0A1Q2CFY4_9ACTN|nr:hypothetical protein [Tessaracoccus flavus]AQP44970.1 hypothetical protein RPIT_09385 [Tessaracoccus flavus]SDY60556.1 hypothetical protein SAMN05428934_102430 [Tessaracoccus flavus]
MSIDAEYPGDPRHPEHTDWLLELGRATYAAAGLSGIAVDLLRVHSGFESEDLYKDPLGRLLDKLRRTPPAVDGIEDFIALSEEALVVRNDVLHALPVMHGLHRRRSDDLGYVRNYYDLASLWEATQVIQNARRKGNEVLYADGGEAVRRWVESA